MALPRFSSIRLSVLSRSSASYLSAQKISPSRAFGSSNKLFQDSGVSSENQLTEEARKRSVSVLSLPKVLSKSEVEGMFENTGFKIVKSQLRLNRFSFGNDAFFHAELANEEQASEAIETMHKTKFLGKFRMRVRPLLPNFEWKNLSNNFNRWVYEEGSSAVANAVVPIKEGRRFELHVEPPAWKSQSNLEPVDQKTARVLHCEKVIAEAFDRFGIESMSSPAIFPENVPPEPKHFCQIDFKTKEGAEEAVRAMDNTKLEGLLILVRKMKLREGRSRQIGRLNMGVLKELQELGLAPELNLEK